MIGTPSAPDFSLVIPLFNESESLVELKSWIDRVLAGRSYEIIIVDDGSKANKLDIFVHLKA